MNFQQFYLQVDKGSILQLDLVKLPNQLSDSAIFKCPVEIQRRHTIICNGGLMSSRVQASVNALA
jgi:hypothetical protein